MVFVRYPALTYFALTFVLSWGGLLWVIGGPGGIPGTSTEVDALLPLAVLAILMGPSVSGILLTAVVGGMPGMRRLWSRLLEWRLAIRWYAVALLVAPLLMLAIFLVLSRVSGQFLPAIFVSENKASLLLAGIATALAAGIFEELGWTGFAVPRLRSRFGVAATGLILGLVWSVWHLLPALWFSGTVSGPFSLASYMADPFLFLVVFRVFMVWVYDRTASLPLAMLMHASLTFGARVITPSGISGVRLLTFDALWLATMSIVLAAMIMRFRSTPPAGQAT